MEHQCRPIGTEIVGTEIHLERDSEIPTHINTPGRHRRTHLIKPATRSSQGNDTTGDSRTPTRCQTRIRCRDDTHRRRTFKRGTGAHIANTLGVAQPSGRRAEAEMHELRATEELRDEISGQRSRRPIVDGVAQRLRRRIPGHHHRMPGTILDVGQGHRHGPEGPVRAYETGVIGDDIGVGLRIVDNVGVGIELDRQPISDTANP